MQNFFQAQLEATDSRAPVLDVGTVVSIGDGIARVYGCEACLAGELLEFADGSLGLARYLSGLLGSGRPSEHRLVLRGPLVRTTNKVANILVRKQYRGRVVNPR